MLFKEYLMTSKNLPYPWLQVADDAYKQFAENNITLLTAELFTDDPAQQVRNLKVSDPARMLSSWRFILPIKDKPE